MSRWTSQDLADYQSRLTGINTAARKAGGSVEKLSNAVWDFGVACYKSELLQQLNLASIKVDPEFKMFADRKFRADWRVTNTRILIEFEGGLFVKGKQGHSSVTGILRDIEKYNLCAIEGWTVIRVAPNHVRSGQALNWIERAIGATNNRGSK